MATISEALARAAEHHQSGRLQAAEQLYRQILQVEPNQPDALHLLGLIAHQVGQHERAVELINRAVALNENSPSFHNNLGGAYHALRRLNEAVASFQRALKLKPDYAEAYHNLGLVLSDQGKPDEAIASYERALTLRPGYPEAHKNLGNALRDQAKPDEAIACYRRALNLKPSYAEAHYALGKALKDQGNLNEAAASYRRAVELKPNLAEAHYNLGNLFKDQGKLDEAVASYQRALSLNPYDVAAHNNLANVFKEQGRLDEAASSYRRALELKPSDPALASNLGNVLSAQGNRDEAAACFRRALECRPDYAEAHNNLGNLFWQTGQRDEAVACFRQALEARPDYAEAHSNLLLALQYCPGITLDALAEAHTGFERQHAAPLLVADAPSRHVPARLERLRLGFVSPDLYRHPVGYFLIRVLENLHREHVDTVCYSDRMVKDSLTHRLQAASTEWHDVGGLNDEALAALIRSDRVDVLFDLAGHTRHNRLLVFARKPAPIQITWAGYVGTTGLNAMDYLLADRYHIPPGAEPFYREQVLRMPDGYVCYDPPEYAPSVRRLPAQDSGRVTFGCFNNPAKITTPVIETWARILGRLPGSRLVLKYKGWDDLGVSQRIADLFASCAISADRLEFLGASPHAELLDEYNRIDLALDSFPYSGGLTTCEALWMGVPVITCPFETFASRHSLSHLSNVGLTETIARDLDEYVQLAAEFASNLPRLAALRSGLRARMAASPLCDGKRFATNLLRVLKDAVNP